MGLNRLSVGASAGPAVVRWEARDVMLYALGVGAGQDDALQELELTTENTEGRPLQVLPSFALVVAQSAGLRPDVGEYDRSKMVHAEQSLRIHRALSVQGEARLSAHVEAIEDKGSGALVSTVTQAHDPRDGAALFTARASIFIRGEGGFDPARRPAGPRATWPSSAPTLDRTVPTRPDQALLYRLCADRNPLHSDPASATRGGFSRPILHGLASYGITVRVLLRACGGELARLRNVSARFTKPVLPGDTLRVQAWRQGNGLLFRTLDAGGAVVIDHGHLQLA